MSILKVNGDGIRLQSQLDDLRGALVLITWLSAATGSSLIPVFFTVIVALCCLLANGVIQRRTRIIDIGEK